MKLTHDEYAFCLHTCRLGGRFRLAENPFTGEDMKFPIDEGLCSDERIAVQRVFDQYGIVGPEPEFEGYALYLPDHSKVRFRGGTLLGAGASAVVTSFSVEITVKELSNKIVKLVLDVARWGNLALMTSTGKAVRLMDGAKDPRILARWPDARFVTSVTDIRSWLESEVSSRKVRVLDF